MENEKKFNVISEPWIPVIKKDGSEALISLKDVFQNTGEIIVLNGETKTLDAAILRFLLSILYSSLITHKDSPYLEFESSDEAVEYWEEIWNSGQLPVEEILQYLEEQKDQFWLVHPDHPFMQSNIAKGGTEYKTGKLFGDLSESSNKVRLFSSRSGKGKDTCSFAEAARWLLYLNAYDDTSAKPKQKGLESPGAGWLGQLGQVYFQGANLFETLMLNFVLLKNGSDLWELSHPYWETDMVASERKPISAPVSPSELLTIRSRWLLLDVDGDEVVGYRLLGGNHFPKMEATAEQFTLWRPVNEGSGKNQKVVGYSPRRHAPDRQIWRDFANYVPAMENEKDTEKYTPGVVSWVQTLIENDVLDSSQILNLSSCSVQYGDKDFFVNDLTGDGFSLHLGLISKMSAGWRKRIFSEIKNCDKLAYAAGELAKEIALASGASGDQVLSNAVKHGREMAYEKLNNPFRSWLQSINPKSPMVDEKVFDEWRDTARKVGITILKYSENNCPESAIFGRTVSENQNSVHYSLVEASNKYFRRLNKLYPKLDRGNDDEDK